MSDFSFVNLLIFDVFLYPFVCLLARLSVCVCLLVMEPVAIDGCLFDDDGHVDLAKRDLYLSDSSSAVCQSVL